MKISKNKIQVVFKTGICLTLLFALLLISCKRFTEASQLSIIQKHRNISYADILKWNYNYDKSVTNAPKIIVDKIQEAFINNTYMIRVPLKDSKGMFYLYKNNNEVQSIFVRTNLQNEKLKNIEFIDTKKYLYSVITFKDGKVADSLYKIELPQKNTFSNIRGGGLTTMSTFWFDLACLLRLGIPKWDMYGNRVCQALDLSGILSWVGTIFDGSSYYGDQGAPPPFNADNFALIFGVNPNYSLVSPNIWSDIAGGTTGSNELSPTSFNYLVSTMQLDEFYSDWIISHSHYASQVYNYISNEPDAQTAILNSQKHFDLLNLRQEYVQFNIRHDIFGDKNKVWWSDYTWIENYYSYSSISNGGGNTYFNGNRTELDYGTGDDDNNAQGNYDNTSYSDYDDQTQPWPTIQNVIPISNFVGWNRTLHPTWQCMNYAKAQIAVKGYKISDYYDANQTIQIYTTTNGANIASAKNGVGYLLSALQRGIPVIVGVDDQPGSSNPKTDNTTDHFIVIVGSGSDTKGNYFIFYDNASGYTSQGANPENKLYYDPTKGIISGKSQTDYFKNEATHDYIITQIRKSK